jgi:potassium-transporting ATPase KdpC subunit
MRLWTACKMTIVLTLLTGITYPVAMVGLARLFFPYRAQGSLIVRDGQVVGSALVGQNFSSARYFHGRPSAAGDKGYDAANSSGSNLGPTNKTLIETVRSRASTLREHEPGINHREIPVDLVTASGSGLDPEITPAAANIQIPRVAKERGLNQDVVRSLVLTHTRGRVLGILGEPGVNVLELNLALDDLHAADHSKSTQLSQGATK